MSLDVLENEPRQEALLAGGCFWGMEDIIRKIPGVIKTTVGYTGGQTANPSYHEVSQGNSGHAEAIHVIFNPTILSFDDLLDLYFRMHDPTTLNRQGGDNGTQYRSAIFYFSEEQKIKAEAAKLRAKKSGIWTRPIVTEIEAAKTFYAAEEYHQDFLEKNPAGYSCHFMR